ncbi:hypothetical protein BC567DRAFT_57328 [Phyllosticta citribraziliensis]
MGGEAAECLPSIWITFIGRRCGGCLGARHGRGIGTLIPTRLLRFACSPALLAPGRRCGGCLGAQRGRGVGTLVPTRLLRFACSPALLAPGDSATSDWRSGAAILGRWALRSYFQGIRHRQETWWMSGRAAWTWYWYSCLDDATSVVCCLGCLSRALSPGVWIAVISTAGE